MDKCARGKGSAGLLETKHRAGSDTEWSEGFSSDEADEAESARRREEKQVRRLRRRMNAGGVSDEK